MQDLNLKKKILKSVSALGVWAGTARGCGSEWFLLVLLKLASGAAEHRAARCFGSASGTAWTCELPWLPEYLLRAFGFFVARPASAEDMRLRVRRLRLEVLRVQFPEEGVAWFYSGVGSGVFLNLDALPSLGRWW